MIDSHKILTDVMLTPVEMGGAGMEDPARRLVQDDATNILTGLAHPSEVVRETFHTVLSESSDFQVESWKKEGRVRPKGSTSYTILQSVRATHNDDNRLHVS